jgi:hypothetical protein
MQPRKRPESGEGGIMPADVKTRARAALNLKKLKLPPKPRVLAIEVEDYVDWTGDEALRIWVVINKNTTNKELQNGKAIIELKEAIHDALLAKGIRLFPYISFTKPSKRFAPDEEE